MALVFLFAAYALVDGIVSLASAQADERWAALLIEGLLGITAAVITFLWPAITALSLVFVIAAWAILNGVAEVMAAVRLRRYISGEWLLALAGVASVVVRVLVATVPLAGALAIALWFGAYAFVFGILLMVLGFRLRTWERALPTHWSAPLPAH